MHEASLQDLEATAKKDPPVGGGLLIGASGDGCLTDCFPTRKRPIAFN